MAKPVDYPGGAPYLAETVPRTYHVVLSIQ
jgi:hypothetical protein